MPKRNIPVVIGSEQKYARLPDVISMRWVNDESTEPRRLKRGFSREQAADYCGVSI